MALGYYLRCTDVDRRICVRVGISSYQSRHDPHQSVERNTDTIASASMRSWQYLGRIGVQRAIVDVQTGRDCTGESQVLSRRSDTGISEKENGSDDAANKLSQYVSVLIQNDKRERFLTIVPLLPTRGT